MKIIDTKELLLCSEFLSGHGKNDWAEYVKYFADKITRDRISKNRSKKKEQLQRRINGLCREGGCKNKITFPALRCEYHLNKMRIKSRETKAKKKEEGCCPRCYNPLMPGPDDGYINCMNCRERITRLR